MYITDLALGRLSCKYGLRHVIMRPAIGPECVESICSKFIMKGCLQLVINEWSCHIQANFDISNSKGMGKHFEFSEVRDSKL